MKRQTREFSPKEKKKIAQELHRNLGPDFLSTRVGFGRTKVTYVEGWLIIALANKIFGFDGWSSKMKNFTQEHFECKDGKYSAAYSCICRIILKDGTFKEDIGFGESENQRSAAQALESAKKKAATDALKRALRQYGNALGNCCYNKNFITEMNNPSKNAHLKQKTMNLHRRADLETRIEINENSTSFDNELLSFGDSIT
ncbi:DNA repair and recombination protein RAD52 [Enteropsectra breve]|nr:DNA repair and recombination protein RAD52 [Enteropsectra breve]